MGSGRYEYSRTVSGDARALRKLKGPIVAAYKARRRNPELAIVKPTRVREAHQRTSESSWGEREDIFPLSRGRRPSLGGMHSFSRASLG